MSKLCDNCKCKFDEKEHIPITLNCSHTICLECSNKLKKNTPNESCSICKIKNKIPFSSTNQNNNFDNSIKLIKSKSSIQKIKNINNFLKKRRFSNQPNFNFRNKNRENIIINKISNTLPKMQKLSKLSFDLNFSQSNKNNFNIKNDIKKRKVSNNLNNNITIPNKTNKNNGSYHSVSNSKINKTDSSFIESEESKFFLSHKFSANQEELQKNKSEVIKDNNSMVKEKETSKYIKQVIIEYCPIHIGKEIQFYCNSCSNLACGACLIDYHNGHNFGLLGDVIDKIKVNISDADNILNELLNQKYNNQKLLNLILNEINGYKNGQELLVEKSFDEIIKKLNEIKQEIIDEFSKKYDSEFQHIEKIQTILEEDANDIQKTKLIINEIIKEFDISSEVKILKQKYYYDNFLYWFDLNINRIYENQINIKKEMFIDPSIKPFPININELINLLNLIEPKNIVYPFLNNNSSILISKSENFGNTSNNFFNKSIKNNNSYSYNNKDEHKNNNCNDYYNENYRFKKYYTDDSILQSKTTSKYNKDYNVSTSNENNNFNNKYYQKENINYNQQKTNLSYITKNENQNTILNQKSSFPMISSPQKLNPIEKEKIDNFYNMIKVNNEVAIYCFTNLNSCLIYQLSTRNWINIPYQNQLSQKIAFQKNIAVTYIPENKFIITGGYNTKSKEINNIAYQINIYDINEVIILKPMKIKRHSHCSVFLSNYLYCIGGYGYNDNKFSNISSKIVSLKSCERYDIKNKEWKIIKDLNSARASFGICIYNRNIFVFGGYDNNNMLSSIEKYEPITDIWITYFIKLPIKIAELGVINFNNKYLFLLGGIDEKKNILDNVYFGRLDQNLIKYSWKEAPKLICPRNVKNNCFYLNNYIYVIGGNSEGICEKYNLIKQKWEMIKSYLTVMNDARDDVKIKYFSSELSFNFSFS